MRNLFILSCSLTFQKQEGCPHQESLTGSLHSSCHAWLVASIVALAVYATMCPKQVNPSHVSPLVLVVSMTRIFSLTVPTLGVCQLIKTAPPHMLAVCIFLDCVHRLWKGVGLHSELCLSYWNVTIVGFKNLLRTKGDSAVSFCITGRNKLHRRKLSCFFLPWQGSWNLSSPKSRQTRLLLPKDFLFLSSSPFPPRSPSFNYVHFIPSLVS